MNNLNILGISGSPRKANTDLLLEAARISAETVQGVRTKTIYLSEAHIEFCVGCLKCFDENPNAYACQIHRDSMDEIYSQLKECHWLLLAAPVYFGQMTGQMKTFMDRAEPLLRYARSQWKFALKNKAGGAIAVGGNRNGE